MKTIKIEGVTCYSLISEHVKLYLTKSGGMMAPVYFHLGNAHWVQPYSITPWSSKEKNREELPTVLKNLRGDFFCFPFGDNPSISTNPHGETANNDWEFIQADATSLTLGLKLKEMPGMIRKQISIEKTFLYIQHEIEGVTGEMTYGHHAVLQLPKKALLKTSHFDFGSVLPTPFDDPKNGDYSSLKVGHQFSKLTELETKSGARLSFENHPCLDGYEDLVMVSKVSNQLAWTAIQMDTYVWISIKNTTDFPSTLFWNTNGGRNSFPWNGKHKNRLGIEEVHTYFNMPIEEAKKNKLPNKISTYKDFTGEKVDLKNIQAVLAIEKSWGKLLDIQLYPDTNQMELRFESKKKVELKLNLAFLEESR